MTGSASEFEFRHRVWFFLLLFCGAFTLYRWQGGSAAGWLAQRLVGPAADERTFLLALRVLCALGALCTLFAAGVRTWATAYLHHSIVHDSALHADRVVADGPYRFVRNPLYLGVQLLALGMAPLAQRWGAIPLILGTWVFQRRLIAREEAELSRTQGETYRAFLAAVPRLWPALRPRLPSSGRRPLWGQAFFGESFLWGFAAATTLFVVTLNARWFGLSCAGAMAFYAITRAAAALMRAPKGSG